MACATPRPAFSLHLSTPLSLKPKLRYYFPTPSLSPKPRKLTVNSVDVSKEDTPASAKPESEKVDPRRLEEKFAVLNTGIYECRSCGYKYDEAVGDPSYPIPPGFQFEKLPDDWRCPTCGAAQNFFESKSVQIAGFAENQQYGLGGNSLTSGQKTVLIYGSLLFFFALFLGGYFLQ
ncbi:Rubredoxin protein [Spatholobus suberectus]|nr:Rubredoxin protein [Spatholobus suberectus]